MTRTRTVAVMQGKVLFSDTPRHRMQVQCEGREGFAQVFKLQSASAFYDVTRDIGHRVTFSHSSSRHVTYDVTYLLELASLFHTTTTPAQGTLYHHLISHGSVWELVS